MSPPSGCRRIHGEERTFFEVGEIQPEEVSRKNAGEYGCARLQGRLEEVMKTPPGER
jgi:hypothetical protein